MSPIKDHTMPNNRHLIHDSMIVRPAEALETGLPIPGLAGRYTVEEGWQAVVTVNGAFREILGAGRHALDRYGMWRDVKATLVNTRIQSLAVSTAREFTIAKPTPVQIDLDLSVEFQVVDPRRVALEVQSPLGGLYDRVINAVRGAVAHATYDEIRTQGEGIAATTLQRLQALNLPAVLGIQVFQVMTTTIKAQGTDGDALASYSMESFRRYQDWQLDNSMLQNSRVSWEWLVLNRPEIAQQMISTHGMLAKELVDKGALDPAAFLNTPAGNPAMSGLNPLNSMLSPFAPMLPNASGHQTQAGQNGVAPQLTGQVDLQTRMQEERQLLTGQIPNAQIDFKANINSFGRPDGSYAVRIVLPRSSGGSIAIYLTCPADYPGRPPSAVEVEVDQQPVAFQPSALQRWAGQYLLEIAREVKNYFG